MASKLSELDEATREALCCWQLFRQLGYAAEQIFTGVTQEGGNPEEEGRWIFIQVQWRGMSFTIGLARTELSEEGWAQVWEDAAKALHEVEEEELQEVFHSSRAFLTRAVTLMSLAKNGIYWPSHERFRHLN